MGEAVTELATLDKVEALESLILQVPQVDLQTKHELSGGVYARTIFIPAGTVLTGARHKKDHVNIVFGDITVSTDDGMKRVGFAHSDTAWTTVCQTGLTDIEAIEEELVEEAERLQTRTLKIATETVNRLED